jgi:YVTN family beta-propeller protein
VLVGLVLSLVAVAATLALLLLTGGGGAVTVVPNSVVRIDPESNTVVEVVPVGTWPDRVAVAGDYVFVVSIESDTVSRVDTTTGEVSTFGNLIHPLGVAAEDARTVWFGSRSSKDVVRIDAESLAVERRLPLPGSSSSFLAVGAGSLWVVHSAISPPRGDQREPTSRVSLATGRLEAEFDTGSAPLFVAYGLGAAWVLNFGDSTLTRIDPENGSMLDFPVGHLASALAVGFRSVWVGSDDQDSVWRLHPATGRTQAIIPVGSWPWEIATGADAVWVTNSADGTVSRIDPESNRVVATIRTGYAPHGVAVAPDGVWVAVARDNPSVPGADSTG